MNEPERWGVLALKVGDVVGGRYELRRDLGRGAGGMVFEAFHQFTHRSTALKVVAADVPRSQMSTLKARLVREARALAAVHHSGIVEVLDGGMLEDGTPFIVMEMLEGRTVEGIITTRGKLGREDTIAIGLQLCDALDALHQVGVVHRDLKPGNVFIVRDRDGVERLKLLDFGIAQIKGDNEDKLTSVGALVGTPAYMSPEQLLALDVDHRADIYALGVSLFECLTGHLPYAGNYQSVLLQVCSPDGKVPKVAEWAPDAGPELSLVVERAIARKPEDRFATAMDMGRALHAAIATPRLRTFFLGAPPMPKFGPAVAPRPNPLEQRRRARRAAYATPVHLITPGGTIDGRSEDVSEGGLLVICRSPCEANVRASVRFAMPIDGKVVGLEVHVRWVRAARPSEPQGPRAIGLEFVDLPEPMKASIAQYVALMGS